MWHAIENEQERKAGERREDEGKKDHKYKAECATDEREWGFCQCD